MGSFACYNNYYTPGGLWYIYGRSGAMGEIAEELQITSFPLAGQSDSEGSNSSLELGNSVARIALSPTNKSASAIKCRWLECGRWFANLELLAAHVTRVHATSGRGGLFYCGWEGCSRGDRGFNARYKMLVHVRTHTNEKPHHCFKCDKSFSRAENLKIHARSHTGERPYVCPVPGCGKAYSNSSDRFKHTRTHSVDKPYCCKVPGCPKRYTDPSSLRKHVKTYRHFPGMGEELEDSARQTMEDGSSTLTSNNQLFDRINLDSNVFAMDKRATTNPNIQVTQSNLSLPKSLKRDCNGLLKLDHEKDCGGNQHSMPSAESLPRCCRAAREKFGEEMTRYCHHPWDDSEAQYNLFRSWINADLAVLSRSLPWGLSLWSHALLQPHMPGGLAQSCFVPDTVKPSHVERHSISSQSSEEAIDDQDLPLDLTVHHESTRT